MQFWLYRIILHLFRFSHRLYSYVQPELKAVHNLKVSISDDVLNWRKKHTTKELCIIHCASLGEFEMSIPLYYSLKQRTNNLVLFSFFSPSGYNHANIPEDAMKIYLPFDVKENVLQFLESLKPNLFIFIKYEYWFTLLSHLNKLKIPYGYVNVIDQKLPPIFKWKLARKLVNRSNFYCVSNEITKSIYDSILDIDIQVFDDLRYVKGQIDSKEDNSLKYSFLNRLKHKTVVVCGSIYPSDFEVIKPALKNYTDTLWILAPHKVNTAFDEKIRSEFKCDKLSTMLLENQAQVNSNIIIVDTIGDLKYLYSFGTIAYIGGGFNKGIHNVIEPLSYGLKVITGPNISSFPEALKMEKKGNLIIVNDHISFNDHLRKHNNSKLDLKEINKEQIIKLNLKNLDELTDHILQNEN